MGPAGRNLRAQDRHALCLARALLADPDVLLLNKPGEMLQPMRRAQLHNVLRVYASEVMQIIQCCNDVTSCAALRVDASEGMSLRWNGIQWNVIQRNGMQCSVVYRAARVRVRWNECHCNVM